MIVLYVILYVIHYVLDAAFRKTRLSDNRIKSQSRGSFRNLGFFVSLFIALFFDYDRRDADGDDDVDHGENDRIQIQAFERSRRRARLRETSKVTL